MSGSGFRVAGIGERLPLALVMVLAALLLVGGFLAAAFNDQYYRSAREREVASQAQVLAASVTAALAFDDRDAVQEYVRAFGVNPMVRHIGVTGSRGQVVAQLDRRPQPGTSAIVVRLPVIQAGVRLGQVEFTASTEGPAPRIIRFALAVALMMMAFVLVAALAAWQAVLRRANRELDNRADQLALANRALKLEMDERAKAEEALRQSQKMEALGQLTGGLAHDFNNLLQAVVGAFQLIQRWPGDAEKVAGWAGQGLEAADRGARLTRQLLTFSRAQKLELVPFVVGDLVVGVRDLLTRTLGPHIRLKLELDDVGCPVMSDPTQLELAVLNLAINARDAMPDGGRLTISTARRRIVEVDGALQAGDYVEVSVTDTGSGMPPHVAARAFDPFFTTKGVGKGTGLGLSQVYGVAQQAGGDARVQSVPGKGTTVQMLLRGAPPGALPIAVPAPLPVSVVSQNPTATILVVDDDDAVRGLACETLELLGYSVASASNGEAALKILEQVRPDAVLLDFAMPGMDGAQLAGHIRRKWPRLPIIFASGHSETKAVLDAVGPGATVLNKPFQLDALAVTLASLLAPERRARGRSAARGSGAEDCAGQGEGGEQIASVDEQVAAHRGVQAHAVKGGQGEPGAGDDAGGDTGQDRLLAQLPDQPPEGG